MTDYRTVQDALKAGTDPAMLCATCPWDRNCFSPPALTQADIDQRIAEAGRVDDQRAASAVAAGRDPGMPTGTLLTALVFAGKDTSAQVCPVFALRLRSSDGRKLADTLKGLVQEWDDQS